MYSKNYIANLEEFANSWWPYLLSFLLGFVMCVRLFMAGPPCPSKTRINGKIVMITGASSGIGLETAKQLAKRGVNAAFCGGFNAFVVSEIGGLVILTCRCLETGKAVVNRLKQEIPDVKLDLRVLDISLLGKIKEFVAQLSTEYEKVDILINNAGIIHHPFEKTSENLDVTLTTNYLGPFLLTHLLLPLLGRSENGRIINISAQAHFSANIKPDDLNKDFHPKQIFGQTKLALVLFTKHLAKLLKGTNITVNAVSPGLVRNTNHFKRISFANSWMAKMSVWPWMWLFLKTPKEGSQTIIYAAVEPALRNISGHYFSDCEQKEPSDLAKEEILAKDMYEASCKLCNLETDRILKSVQ